MGSFSQRSLALLAELDPELQRVLRTAIRTGPDFTILPLGARRTPEQQAQLLREGKTKTLQSKHLTGEAVDLAPFPVDWNDLKRFHVLAGYILATATALGVTLRWGGDWDSDFTYTDQTFHDLPHFELR